VRKFKTRKHRLVGSVLQPENNGAENLEGKRCPDSLACWMFSISASAFYLASQTDLLSLSGTTDESQNQAEKRV